ncbi:hypothetical protein CTEN210_00978 [Chaetoceros tenuissimus]|uniref:RING-type domain-containing protein n=1 Tax=Chaetoceros tenuissimus TaxID=426638 RepID=A0AAD3CGK5_9STRA|nr:hypothetical protein CTEN210_00978 [Chaetoceros tenuissimus]
MVWLDKFQQLVEYKSKYGHCNVPSKHEENQSLGNWVSATRSQYKHSSLSKERINMLNDIGFEWTAPQQQRRDDVWNDKLEQLKLYKSKHGDCNMPQTYDNQPLANWVKTQRSQYKHSSLSKERIKKLNDIGFVWSMIEYQPPPSNETTKMRMEKHAVGNEIEESRKRPREEMFDEEIGQAPKIMKQNSCSKVANDNSTSSSEEMNEMNSDLENAQNLLDRQLKEKGEMMLRLKNENDVQKQQIHDLTIKYDELEKELQTKSEEYQSLESKRKEEQQVHETLYQEKDEKIADLSEKLRSKIEVHNTELKSLCSTNKSLEEKLKAKQSEHDGALSKKDDEIKTLLSNVSGLECQLAAKQKDIENMVTSNQHERKSLEVAVSQKDEQIRKLEYKLQTKQKEYDLLTKTNEEIQQQILYQQHQLQWWSQQQYEQHQLQWRLQHQYEQLQSLERKRIEEQQAHQKEINDKFIALEEEKQKLNDMLELKEEECSQLAIEKEKRISEIETLNNHIHGLNQNFNKRQKDFESLSKLQQDLKEELECPICIDTFENPYMIPECCHRFCKHCIEESLARNRKECPMCRCMVTSKRALRKDELICKISEVLTCNDQSKDEST